MNIHVPSAKSCFNYNFVAVKDYINNYSCKSNGICFLCDYRLCPIKKRSVSMRWQRKIKRDTTLKCKTIPRQKVKVKAEAKSASTSKIDHNAPKRSL